MLCRFLVSTLTQREQVYYPGESVFAPPVHTSHFYQMPPSCFWYVKDQPETGHRPLHRDMAPYRPPPHAHPQQQYLQQQQRLDYLTKQAYAYAPSGLREGYSMASFNPDLVSSSHPQSVQFGFSQLLPSRCTPLGGPAHPAPQISCLGT